MSQAQEKISGDHGCRIVQSGQTFTGSFWAFEPIGATVSLSVLKQGDKNALDSNNADHYLGVDSGDNIAGYGLLTAKYNFTDISVSAGKVKIWRNNE